MSTLLDFLLLMKKDLRYDMHMGHWGLILYEYDVQHCYPYLVRLQCNTVTIGTQTTICFAKNSDHSFSDQALAT
jgi:hypothetical protein